MKTINHPVNISALCKAYKLAKWKWFDGYPNRERLMNAVDSGLAEVGTTDEWGGRIVEIYSGGLRFRIDRTGFKTVRIDQRLAKHYTKGKAT